MELDRGCRGQPQNKFALLLFLTAEILEDLSETGIVQSIRSAKSNLICCRDSGLRGLRTSTFHSSVLPRRSLCENDGENAEPSRTRVRGLTPKTPGSASGVSYYLGLVFALVSCSVVVEFALDFCADAGGGWVWKRRAKIRSQMHANVFLKKKEKKGWVINIWALWFLTLLRQE